MRYLMAMELILVTIMLSVSSMFGIVHNDIQSDYISANAERNATYISVDLDTMDINASVSKPQKKLSAYGKELEEMTPQQYEMLLSILHYGEQYELGITLAAISWKESGIGKFNMNLADGKYGSFGPFHILLDYSAIRHGKTTDWGRSRLAEKLIYDIEFSIQEAVNVLKAFKTKTCDTTCAIARYNGGYSGRKNAQAKAYAKDVEKRKVAIIKYMERHYVTMKVDSIAKFGSKKAKLALNESWHIPDFAKLYEIE